MSLGLTKAKTIMHIVERRVLLVVKVQQHYGLKPKDGHLYARMVAQLKLQVPQKDMLVTISD